MLKSPTFLNASFLRRNNMTVLESALHDDDAYHFQVL